MKAVIFYLGLGLLFTHEMDAMPNHEWRILPILSALSESAGKTVFVVAHVPIIAVVVASVASLDQRIRLKTQYIFCGFIVFHTLVHLLFSRNVAYEFGSLVSMGLIYGAGLCGASYFLIDFFKRNKNLA